MSERLRYILFITLLLWPLLIGPEALEKGQLSKRSAPRSPLSVTQPASGPNLNKKAFTTDTTISFDRQAFLTAIQRQGAERLKDCVMGLALNEFIMVEARLHREGGLSNIRMPGIGAAPPCLEEILVSMDFAAIGANLPRPWLDLSFELRW